MTAKPRHCPAVLWSIVFLALAAGAAPLSAQTYIKTPEAAAAMSKEQLCGWYADSVLKGMRSVAPVPPEIEAATRQCVFEALDPRFTENEMRTLYLEPPDMDIDYYLGKLEGANSEIGGCVKKAWRQR
jgi:hypothetical protein